MKKTIQFEIEKIAIEIDRELDTEMLCMGVPETYYYKPNEIHKALADYLNHVKNREDKYINLEIYGKSEYGNVVLRIKDDNRIQLFSVIEDTKFAKEAAEKLDKIREILR